MDNYAPHPQEANRTVITVRNSSCGQVMFSQVGVKNSVHGGRGGGW